MFEDKDITLTTVHERIKIGIARSFQIVSLFDGLSVFDNVALSIFARDGKAVRFAALAEHDQAVRTETFDVLGQFGLADKSRVLAGGLAQGERKLLDVAVAYALRPKLLFLDEPTSGVSTRDKTQIMDTVSSVVRAGTVTAVVIEHDMDVVFRYSDRIVMMHEGRFLADGTPEEIKANNEVASILSRRSAVDVKGQREGQRESQVLLEVDAINTFRGPAHILHDVSLTVAENEVVSLVGRNGAGRTTTIESITGLLPVRSGGIRFRGRDITRLAPHRRARCGIGYAPENSGIFPDLTVAENLMISRWLSDKTRHGAGSLDAEARALTVFPEVGKFLSRPGLNLSGGQKKMVSIARAMALAPSLMILDEAFEGLASVVVKRFPRRGDDDQGLSDFAPARGIQSHQRGGHRRSDLCDRSWRNSLPRHPE